MAIAPVSEFTKPSLIVLPELSMQLLFDAVVEPLLLLTSDPHADRSRPTTRAPAVPVARRARFLNTVDPSAVLRVATPSDAVDEGKRRDAVFRVTTKWN
jgi:hypothetical protein